MTNAVSLAFLSATQTAVYCRMLSESFSLTVYSCTGPESADSYWVSVIVYFHTESYFWPVWTSITSSRLAA